MDDSRADCEGRVWQKAHLTKSITPERYQIYQSRCLEERSLLTVSMISPYYYYLCVLYQLYYEMYSLMHRNCLAHTTALFYCTESLFRRSSVSDRNCYTAGVTNGSEDYAGTPKPTTRKRKEIDPCRSSHNASSDC